MKGKTLFHNKRLTKKNISLQSQLYIAYLGMFCLALTAFAVFFYVFFSHKLIAESNNNLVKQLSSVQNATEAQINNMNTISVNINYSSILKGKPESAFDLSASDVLYKDLADLFVLMNGTETKADYIYVYDRKGNKLQVASSKKLSHVDIKNEPWYKETISRDGAFYLSTPYKSTVGNYSSYVISLYRTYVNSERQMVGIVETVKQCKNIFSEIQQHENANIDSVHFYIYNERGELIYPYSSKNHKSIPNYPNLMSEDEENNAAVEKLKNPINDKTEYVTAETSGETGWQYYAVQDNSSVLAPLHSLLNTLIVFFTLLLIVAVVIARVLSAGLVRPIIHLKHLIQGMKLSTLGKDCDEYEDAELALNSETKELYDSFKEMNTKLKTSMDQLIKAQEAELEARSLALQSQMSPHFYYNTLSGIMVLAENNDTNTVSKMCQNLSGMMRYVTDFKTKIVSIGMELEYIEEYLSCMKVRNQNSLSYEFDIPEEILSVKLPKLCIHPLVENAYKYGTNCNPPWFIKIAGNVTEEGWEITVSDCGPGFTEKAIRNIDEKIAYLNAHHAELPKLQIDGLGLVNIYTRLSLNSVGKVIFRYGNDNAGHAYITIGCRYKEINLWNIQ